MFNHIVELYRMIGRPALSSAGSFDYSGSPDELLQALIKLVSDLPSHYGEMNYHRVKSGLTSFEFTPISSGENSFFSDFSSLVQKTPSLGCGNPLINFYIVTEDWASDESVINTKNEKILKVCKLIKDLTKIAVSEHLQPSSYSLVFSTSSGNNKPPKTMVLQTKISSEILEIDIKKTSLIGSLASEENKGRIHLEERRAILNGAICEALDALPEDHPNRFVALLERWDLILDSYWQNFQIYIHSFSFEKVRKEFAQAELDYGAKLSSAFGDIAGKMLALPVSLIALITLYKATSAVEIFVTSLGLMMSSIILIGILLNQLLNIQRLNSSLSISFENLTKSIATYPKNLRRLILSAQQNIDRQKFVVTSTIIVFAVLALAPFIGALLFLMEHYAQYWHEWLLLNFHAS
ncbi:hypothetical protein [Pseudomonas sp. SJZ131]|uniref:hypothetical protein n=1 Tax=Pseudomonas sp. SJZ131 TaxID=2572895 RepID=UPI00119B0A8F|nr:hypothetical protein [Pseudomonas sp. SJZ131]TWD52543.1 hypothetical protein FBY12_1069 [Pseudomonas sp. SJZ131]